MQRVFVLGSDRKPLDPCHPARARKLLKQRRAAVFRRYPFTIILKDRTAAESVTHPHRLKVDPGSKTTGLAVVQEEIHAVVWAAELCHRGDVVAAQMKARAALRRGRRHRKCRYRPARYNNRKREQGWLTPCMRSRVENVMTWVERLRRYVPVAALSLELATRKRWRTQRSAASNTNRESCTGTRFASTCWRNGAASASTVARGTSRWK